MARTTRIGALAAAVGTLVAVGLLLLIMVVVEAGPAGATFPGKNGKIAFVRDRGLLGAHIYTINPDGSGLTKISTRPWGDSSPAWSPDGKKIAFSGLTCSGPPFSGLICTGLLRGNYDIYVVNANGSRLKRITENQASDFSPSWSPDSKKIAFVRASRKSSVYKIRVDGTGLKRLTGTKRIVSDPAWSPNGKQIAFSLFVGREKTGGQIFTMNATDGSQKTNLTHTGYPQGQESQPDWSPDGKKIAYTSFIQTESHGAYDRVFTMNADGSNQKNLTKQTYSSSPAWSPDGKKIVFLRDDIYVMKSDGTKVKRITNNPNSGELVLAAPDWQPLPWR